MTIDRIRDEIRLVQVLYIQTQGVQEMNDFIEQCDKDHFANSQSCCDLRAGSGAVEVEIQLIE